MIHITDPRQEALFDPFEHLLSKQAFETIKKGWQGIFRHVILELLPVAAVAKHFNPMIGRPTKELYSMAGLMLIMEFKNWGKETAAEAYMCHVDLWYALNMGPGMHGLCTRTLDRYQGLFRDNELAQQVMHDVTSRLVALLEQDISKQRLDSTHVFSDMATFGRTRMMGVTIKRFLTQVKRHDRAAYDALPEELLERYQTSAHQLFCEAMKDTKKRSLLRQQVAEDMHALIEGFADNERINGRETFKLLCTVFDQQCEIVDKEIEVEASKGKETKDKETKGDAMTIGAFEVDAANETVQKCPAGHAPQSSGHNPETGRTRTEMDPGLCARCPMQADCPIKQTRNGAHLEHTDKERRLDERRRDEKTDEFRKRYKKRSGIEATNSGIKRRTGMDRIGVRGKKGVFHAILMKVTGWNILQAARSTKMRDYVAGKMEKARQAGQQNPSGGPESGTMPACGRISADQDALKIRFRTKCRAETLDPIAWAA